MTDVLGSLGRRSAFLVLALSLALGCSSQQAPDSASGGSSGSASGGAGGDAIGDGGAAADTGFQCGILAHLVPIQAGDAACTISFPLPDSISPTRVKIQDQSMVTIAGPYDNRDYGWRVGDPPSTIILIGSTCADAMSGKLTAVTILVACISTGIP